MTEFNASNLPSKTVPYQVKSFEMKPFRVAQIMQLSRAVALQSIQPAVDALDGVMEFDANLLTDGDFYYLLAHQRIHAYAHSPLQATWTCSGLVFAEKEGLKRNFTKQQLADLVEEYDTVPDTEKHLLTDPSELIVTSKLCGHENQFDITMEMLNTVFLDPELKLAPGLDFPRVSTLGESQNRRDNPEQQNIVQAARWVSEGKTIDDKIAVLEAQPDLVMFEQALRANATIRHGLSRIVTVHCAACGEPANHSFDVRPETFFDV